MNSEDAVAEFERKYEKEKPMYKACGEYVLEYIKKQLHLSLQEQQQIIKVLFPPRVKDTDSIIAKAFYRKGKNYTDPINQITDKVGIRFVVMVTNQIKIIEDVIKEATIWKYSKDQDYQDKIEEKPDVFGYQSVHYVVRNINEIHCDGIIIKAGTACEIQIRTLEQHAYAELSHDYFYKNDDSIASTLRRSLARSMALNETTDELFSKVYDMMSKEKQEYTELMSVLRTKYPFERYSEKLNKSIYDNTLDMIKKYNVDGLKMEDYIQKFMIDNIQARQDLALFRQPIVLILYFLVECHHHELLEVWEQPKQQLELIFSDLGIAYDDWI